MFRVPKRENFRFVSGEKRCPRNLMTELLKMDRSKPLYVRLMRVNFMGKIHYEWTCNLHSRYNLALMDDVAWKRYERLLKKRRLDPSALTKRVMCRFCESRKECKKIEDAIELCAYTILFQADRALRKGAPTSTTEPPICPSEVIGEKPASESTEELEFGEDERRNGPGQSDGCQIGSPEEAAIMKWNDCGERQVVLRAHYP